jgi:hypothetical protein
MNPGCILRSDCDCKMPHMCKRDVQRAHHLTVQCTACETAVRYVPKTGKMEIIHPAGVNGWGILLLYENSIKKAN